MGNYWQVKRNMNSDQNKINKKSVTDCLMIFLYINLMTWLVFHAQFKNISLLRQCPAKWCTANPHSLRGNPLPSAGCWRSFQGLTGSWAFRAFCTRKSPRLSLLKGLLTFAVVIYWPIIADFITFHGWPVTHFSSRNNCIWYSKYMYFGRQLSHGE